MGRTRAVSGNSGQGPPGSGGERVGGTGAGTGAAGAEDPSDCTGILADRAVREGEVPLLPGQVAMEDEEEVLGPGGLARGEDALQHRVDDAPDLAPALAPRSPEPARVLGDSEDRDV